MEVVSYWEHVKEDGMPPGVFQEHRYYTTEQFWKYKQVSKLLK